ncbi:MAG: CoA transferase, partial [Candidatus Poseidonia sp.]|nr:CoA transferase [Poseidonia sp.]
VPYRVFEANDGWFAIGVGTKRQWLVLVEALGLEAPGSWSENSVRIAQRAKVEALVQSAVKQHARTDLEVMLSGIPCAPVNTVNEALNDTQTKARGGLVEHKGVTTLASPLRFIQPSNENSDV